MRLGRRRAGHDTDRSPGGDEPKPGNAARCACRSDRSQFHRGRCRHGRDSGGSFRCRVLRELLRACRPGSANRTEPGPEPAQQWLRRRLWEAVVPAAGNRIPRRAGHGLHKIVRRIVDRERHQDPVSTGPGIPVFRRTPSKQGLLCGHRIERWLPVDLRDLSERQQPVLGRARLNGRFHDRSNSRASSARIRLRAVQHRGIGAAELSHRPRAGFQADRSRRVDAAARHRDGRGRHRIRGADAAPDIPHPGGVATQTMTLPKVIRGKAWKFGANIDTDQIIPAKYAIYSLDEKELGKHAMEGVPGREGWAAQVQPGDILVADSNFGCGSSREIAPVAIRGAGVSLVIADSYARIFFRNAINMGYPIMQSPQAAEAVEDGDDLEVDLEEGVIRNFTKGDEYRSEAFPKFMNELLQMGGLVPWVRQRLQERRVAAAR